MWDTLQKKKHTQLWGKCALACQLGWRARFVLRSAIHMYSHEDKQHVYQQWEGERFFFFDGETSISLQNSCLVGEMMIPDTQVCEIL